MRAMLALGLGLMMVLGCTKTEMQTNDLEQLFQVDREFSKTSAEKGMAYAFDFYQADSAMMLRDKVAPIIGRESINALYKNIPDGAKLTWEPLYGDISNTGDLGYTVGSWLLEIVDSTGQTNFGKGNYITIWKRQTDGSWKYVFDTGTEGQPENSSGG